MRGGVGGDSSCSEESSDSDNSSSCGTISSDEEPNTVCSDSSSSSSNKGAHNSPSTLFAVESSICDTDGYHECQRSDGILTESEHDAYSSSVREWTQRVPIGMNLCPWAKLSHKDRRIKYVTCPKEVQSPVEFSKVVWKEIEKLLGISDGQANRSLPAWSTTLVICPHVKTWKNDYLSFETFVKQFGREKAIGDVPTSHVDDGLGAITLVPFHPHFLRWRGLPKTITNGSRIRCHKGLAGFSKSQEAHSATVVDLHPNGFGRRRIRVRFDDDNETTNATRRRRAIEQCVPLDWVVLADSSEERPPLPDNLMHRTPFPVVHILRTSDLQNLSIHDVSRLKRRNARRMLSEKLV